MICCHRWHAPRVDVENWVTAADVEHVCDLAADHLEWHRCVCGADLPRVVR